MPPFVCIRHFALSLCLLCCVVGASHARGSLRSQLKAWKIELRDGVQASQKWRVHEERAVVQLLARLPHAYKRLGALQLELHRKAAKCGKARKPLLGLHLRHHRQGVNRVRLRPMAYFSCSIQITRYSSLPPFYQKLYLLGLQHNVLHELTHLLDAKKGYSRSRRWKELSGWGLALLGVPLGPAENVSPRGFASKRGMKSPAEDFATFAEAFFFPLRHEKAADTIKCRMPFKFAFFARLFPMQARRFRSIRCSSYRSWIDPAKVHSLELLYASPSAYHFSSFSGHMLLRIKMKSRLKNIENPEDVVVSFVAQTTHKGWRIAVGGLAGWYKSLFEVRSLGEVVSSYTHQENRDLWRYQLKLSPKQRRAVLKWLYHLKQNYRFHYYFLTKNCAATLVKHLRVALGALGKSDFGDIGAPFIVAPTFLLSKLSRQGYIKEVGPSFLAISRRAQLAGRHATKAHQTMASLARSHSLSGVPGLAALNHSSEAIRKRAYQGLRGLLKRKAYRPIHAAIFRFASFQSDVELERFYRDEKKELSLALEELRELLYQSRYYLVDGKPRERKPIYLPQLHKKADLKHRAMGSAFLGFQPLEISTGISLLGWKEAGVQLRIDTAFYAQTLGDPSRFRLTVGTALTVLSSSLSLSLDRLAVARWDNRLFWLKMFKSKKTIGGERVPSIFGGLQGLGLELKLLHVSGDEPQDELARVQWAGAKVLANLASSEGHRSYLYVGLGLDVSTLWHHDATHHNRTSFGLPLTLVGRVELGGHYRTMVKGSVTYTPEFTTLGTLEHGIQGALMFTQLLGQLLGAELRMRLKVQYHRRFYRAVDALDRGDMELFQASLGLHIRR